jgi:hypothetical protein
MTDAHYDTRADGCDAPTRSGGDHRMQIAHVTRDVIGSGLALPIDHLIEPADYALRDKARLTDALARRDDVPMGGEALAFAGQLENGSLFFGR